MIGLGEVVTHVHRCTLHIWICGHFEEYHLSIHHLLAFSNQLLDALSLFIQILKACLLYFVIRFLFISNIYITFQVNNILQRPQSYATKHLPDIPLILCLTMLISFFKVIANVFFQSSNMFSNT